MPTYYHKETGKRFLFIHIPRTGGRFLQENFKLNGFESEQKIWKSIDGIEITHLSRELYEKHLNVKGIPHIAIIRDPLERYLSLSSYSFHPKDWFRRQVDYLTKDTFLWKFEDGFGNDFSDWIGKILDMDFVIREFDKNYIYNEIGQKLTLEYMQPNYKKISNTVEISNYVKSYYSEDYDLWLTS
jgi:hypothetical protein